MAALRARYFERHSFEPLPPSSRPEALAGTEAFPVSFAPYIPNNARAPTAPDCPRTPPIVSPPVSAPRTATSERTTSRNAIRDPWQAAKRTEQPSEWYPDGSLRARHKRKGMRAPPRRSPATPRPPSPVASLVSAGHRVIGGVAYACDRDAWNNLPPESFRVNFSSAPARDRSNAKDARPRGPAADAYGYSPIRRTSNLDSSPPRQAPPRPIGSRAKRAHDEPEQVSDEVRARERRAQKLSSVLENTRLIPSPRRGYEPSPPRPSPPPPPHPTISATYADFALSVSPEGPLHPGSTMTIAITLGDLEIARRLDRSLPSLHVELDACTTLALDFAAPENFQEHVLWHEEFEDKILGSAPEVVFYEAELPRGGKCTSCGTDNPIFPPTFEPIEKHEEEVARTSTVWNVRATFGPQTAVVALDVRAPDGPLNEIYQRKEHSLVPCSSSEIVSSAQGEWDGFELEESAITYTARPLNRDNSLLLVDVGLSLRLHPHASATDLEALLDRLKPSASSCELYGALLEYSGDHLVDLPGILGDPETAPLKASAEVIGAQSSDPAKWRARVRVRLGVRAPLSQCRPFASCAGYRVEYRLRLVLGALTHSNGAQDGIVLDVPLFRDEQLLDAGFDGRMENAPPTRWWCGVPGLWQRVRTLLWGTSSAE